MLRIITYAKGTTTRIVRITLFVPQWVNNNPNTLKGLLVNWKNTVVISVNAKQSESTPATKASKV